jgi:hypothetical protein
MISFWLTNVILERIIFISRGITVIQQQIHFTDNYATYAKQQILQ